MFGTGTMNPSSRKAGQNLRTTSCPRTLTIAPIAITTDPQWNADCFWLKYPNRAIA